MRRVILESPYSGPTAEAIARNIDYARAAVRDALNRGESAFPSHLLFTQPGILRDEIPGERAKGMEAGRAWYTTADYVVVYEDLGISPGMADGIAFATSIGLEIFRRKLG